MEGLVCSLLVTFFRQLQYFLLPLDNRTIVNTPMITNIMMISTPLGTMPTTRQVPMSVFVMVVGGVGGVDIGSVVRGGRVVVITVQELEDGIETLSHERFDGGALMEDRSVSNEEKCHKFKSRTQQL